jgi:hypothetical protein
MATPPSGRQTQPEMDRYLEFKKVDSVTVVTRDIIKYIGYVLIARYVYLIIAVLAGKSTSADIAIDFLGKLKVAGGIGGTLIVGGILYGAGQAALRRRNIQRLASVKNELERIIDPNRTSSHLTKRGKTPPGDKA